MTFSIIKKSQLEGAQRIDAEYYQPEYLKAVKIIRTMVHSNLGQMLSTFTDYHANGSYESLHKHVKLLNNPDYALMIRAVDLQNDNFKNNVRYVSKNAYNFLKKTKIFGNEIIIDKIGNAGEVFLMPELEVPVTLGMNLFLLRFKKDIDPEFIYVFLTSKIGKQVISQKITGTIPTSIDKQSIRAIEIPIPDKTTLEHIKDCTIESFELKKRSVIYYSQAEDLLLQELGLKNFEEKDELFSIVNFSEVEKVKRMDAEYFQSKYEKLIKVINQHNGCKLADLATIKKGVEIGAEAYKEEGKFFIRVSNLSKEGIIDRDQKFLSDELFSKLKKDFQPQQGEILLAKDASPGVACVLNGKCDGIISGGVVRLKIKQEDICEPEFLALCINSLVGKLQIEREVGGSIILHWKTDQIKYFHVPILPKETQQKITDLVRKSHAARKKSKVLLEEAKRKVEEMIEKGGEKS